MARFFVLFLAMSFLVGCGKAKRATGTVERHHTYPYGLGEGAFSAEGESKNTPLLIMIEKSGSLRALVVDWDGDKAFEFDTAAEHEFTHSSPTLEVTYQVEGIAGSIVMTRSGRRMNATTSTWEDFREVHGLHGRVGDDFVKELVRRRTTENNDTLLNFLHKVQ